MSVYIADVSFEAVTLWHARTTVLFTRPPTPAQQCVCKCVHTAELLFPRKPFHMSVEIKKSALSCGPACCHSEQSAPLNTYTFTCNISTANRSEHAPSLQGDTRAFVHVNTYEQHAAGWWQRCDGEQGRDANLGARLHMSFPHLCCQDQNHHLLRKKEVTHTSKPWMCLDGHIASEVARVGHPAGHQSFSLNQATAEAITHWADVQVTDKQLTKAHLYFHDLLAVERKFSGELLAYITQ